MTLKTIRGELVGCYATARIAPFQLARPSAPSDVLALMRDGATVMSGGLDLIDRMKGGFRATIVAHLTGVGALKRVTWDGSMLRIGAALTHRAIAADPTVQAVFPDLARIWKGIGNARVQARGSLGGNLMADVPGYEAATILTACEARATIMNLDGERCDLPVAQAAESRGLLLHVSIPEPQRIRLAMDRSIRDYVLISRADHAEGKVVVAVGGNARKPAVAVGADPQVPSLSGPHASYLEMVVPTLLARMRHA